MSFPLQIRPDAMLREVIDYQSAMLRSMDTLRAIGEPKPGSVPRTVVYQEEHARLYHYRGGQEPRLRVPLLIVYALVNRPQIADLQDQRSLVQGLLAEGVDVYLLEWNDVNEADRFLCLDDYINGIMDRAVDFIRGTSNEERIHMLGICQGGTFSICYTAAHGEKIRTLVPVVAPVDFQTPDDRLSHIVRYVDTELMARVMGNVPGDVLNWVFVSLQPLHLLQQKYVALADLAEKPAVLDNFMHMEQWIFDSPDLAGQAWQEFISLFYQKNALVNDCLRIGQYDIRLGDIKVPVCNVYAARDHLVPPEASRILGGLISSTDYNEIEFDGGHVGVFVSSRAGKEIPPGIAAWLQQH